MIMHCAICGMEYQAKRSNTPLRWKQTCGSTICARKYLSRRISAESRRTITIQQHRVRA